MADVRIRHCLCWVCQHESDHPDTRYHHEMNLVLSRLDEPRRCRYAAVEARRLGHGGIPVLPQITGLDEKTTRRGSTSWPRISAIAQQREPAGPARVMQWPTQQPDAEAA